MGHSLRNVLALKSYQHQAEGLVRNYLLSDPFIPYSSVLGGIFTFKMVYDLTQLISAFYFRSYNGLTKIQRTEWNNRGISTVHAIYISAMSLYFVFWSNLFSDQNHSDGLITFRNSSLSTFALGVSVGYFVSDLGMICWLYPTLGGVEYIVHHSLSGIAVAYSMFTGEGQLYTFMVLISEVTTPEINMRWYLDVCGLKKSTAYLINGIAIFFAWLVCSEDSFVCLHVRPCLSPPHSGHADAHHWFRIGVFCTNNTCNYELSVVREDSQRVEEDFIKKPVRRANSIQTTYSMRTSLSIYRHRRLFCSLFLSMSGKRDGTNAKREGLCAFTSLLDINILVNGCMNCHTSFVLFTDPVHIYSLCMFYSFKIIKFWVN